MFVAVLVALTMQNPPVAGGDPAAGKEAWTFCDNCHGDDAEGGFAPDLAGGRGLTFAQFQKAVREPWGMMPRFTQGQVSDQALADIRVFLAAKPPVARPGPWRWEYPPESSPSGQRYQSAFGCGQCHEPELRAVRYYLGAVKTDVDFAYFAKQVYAHYEKFPRGGMPSFSRDRLVEPVLREIYRFIEDAGYLAYVRATLTAAAPAGGSTTYTLTVSNNGVVGKGLTAEEMTVFVRVPPAAKVVNATGTNYKGVRPLAGLGVSPGLRNAPHARDGKVPERPKPDVSGDVAVWELPHLAPGEKQVFTLTLAGPAPTEKFLGSFEGSTVYWKRPSVRVPPGMTYRDLRLPDTGDNFAIPIPTVPAAK